jgi:hypothetical protein
MRRCAIPTTRFRRLGNRIQDSEFSCQNFGKNPASKIGSWIRERITMKRMKARRQNRLVGADIFPLGLKAQPIVAYGNAIGTVMRKKFKG